MIGQRERTRDKRFLHFLHKSAERKRQQRTDTSAPIFNLTIPQALPAVDSAILDPRNSYADSGEWDSKATRLAGLFIENFEQYTDTDSGKSLVSAGPKLD